MIELGANARGVMAPQCGLAPGFIGIVGAAQVGAFDVCRSLRLRVGALPQNPTGLMGYAFNWSPEGVVNEYLNDCEVIEDGERKWVSSMEWHETALRGGRRVGGVHHIGRTRHHLRDLSRAESPTSTTRPSAIPGHMRLMNFFFHELLMRERRELAGEILTHAKPPVDADVVYVHVSAEGTIDGRLQRREFVRAYRPRVVAGREEPAIAWTTAASAAAVVRLVRDGVLPSRGFLKQEAVPLDAFLATPTGTLFRRPAPRHVRSVGGRTTIACVRFSRFVVRGCGSTTATSSPSMGSRSSVSRGECFGLLGPNGAGKTTTIEILEGLLAPDAGEVEVLGLRWATHERELRERLGIQLQETQLADKLTVEETLRLFRSLLSHGPRGRRSCCGWSSWRGSGRAG